MNLYAIGVAAFALGFAWRIVDECLAKALFRLGAIAARYEESRRSGRHP